MGQSIAELNESPIRKYFTVGVCGLDCGLCPRYYTAGPSRCPGCGGPEFFNKHPSCSFITCCVRKKNLEVCSECADFPCPKFKSYNEYEQVTESTSYPSYKKVLPNLDFIKQQGIGKFIEQQNERIKILETMLENFDDGRSRSFFCKKVVLLDLSSLRSSIEKANRKIKTEEIKQDDVKNKARILKAILSQ
jgi:hypothetical protein